MPDTSALPIAPAGVQQIPHHLIDTAPLNPRKAVDAAELAQLADSIVAHGVLQNIVLRPHPAKPGRFELVAGERRWRAACLAVRDKRLPADFALPAAIRAVDDTALLLLATAENVARADLSPLEEGRAFKALLERKVPKADIARQVGRTVRHVELRLALVDKLGAEAQAALADGRLDLAKARALTLAPVERQAAILKDALPRDGREWTPFHTADDVARAARRQQIMVGAAPFALDCYKGAIETDPDDPKRRWFADPVEFARLQKAWIAGETARLIGQGHAFVKVLHQHMHRRGGERPYDWEPAKGKAAGALIVVDSGRRYPPRIFKGVAKRAGRGQVAARPSPAEEAARKAAEEFGDWCRRFKTHALQRFVLADPSAAELLAMFKFGCFDGLGDGFIPDAAERDPSVTRALAPFGLDKPGWRHRPDGGRLVAALRALNAAKRAAAFRAILAGHLVLERENWNQPFGDAPRTIAPLRAVGFDPLKGWTMDRAFLDACPADVIERIGRDVLGDQLPTAPHRNAWSAAILAAPKAKAYRPPWLELGTAAELAARLKKPPAAAPAAKAKAPKGKTPRAKKGGR